MEAKVCEYVAPNSGNYFSPAAVPCGGHTSGPSSTNYAPRAAPDLIMDHLYLGDEKDAYNKKTITRLNITHVLTVTLVPDFVQYKRLFPPNVNCLVVDILDDAQQNIAQYFNQTNAFIDAGRRVGNVLVHCVMGVSRSASIVIAYLMYTRCVDFATAFRMVHRARPIICPNIGFRHQLIAYGKKLLSVTFSIHFVARYGQQLHIVGSHTLLGSWQITETNKMQWTDGNIWKITLPVRGMRFEYKYVVVEENSAGVRWETRSNRLYECTDKEVADTWDGSLVCGCSNSNNTTARN
ncbi:dual specificity protein phosphatase 1 [Pelomyxa schiedti]|nr:dual specificity protein phosphatase 1 [Pelomyxa schiedti]